jgi:threonine dehydrogenase-like Zn-dependent dehydrogenase
VLGTTSDRRAERVAALGATPLPYGPGVVDRVHELAPQGVTVAIDLVGTDEALDQSIALVADKARIATLVRGADAASASARSAAAARPAHRAGARVAREAIPVRGAHRGRGVHGRDRPRGAARRRRRGPSPRR